MIAKSIAAPRAIRPQMTRRGLLASAGIFAGVKALGLNPSPREITVLRNCPVVELRQYTLHAGGRAQLIQLFESHFIQPQEALGIHVLGPFCDREDPNRFVWMRGFPNMAERSRMLAAFYGGPAWQEHRNAANATMIDSDNVLLLRPASAESVVHAGVRSSALALQHDSLLVATIYYVENDASDQFASFFQSAMLPRLVDTGANVIAVFRTEGSANNFPKLPIREKEHVLVWLAVFQSEEQYRSQVAALRAGADWREHAPEDVLRQLARKPEVLMLTPTPHSKLGD
ncbi:MAG: NIPSNAP family protein [Acidobacteriota bacterium]|nr:NIPSNAP family protein [Acidobacteriota bacterium]